MRLAALALCLAACSTSAPSATMPDAAVADVGTDAAVDAGSDFDRHSAAAARLRAEMRVVVREAESFVAARPEPAGWTAALRAYNQASDIAGQLGDAGIADAMAYDQRAIEITEQSIFPAYCAIRDLLRPSFTPSVEPRRSCADTDPEWWRAYL